MKKHKICAAISFCSNDYRFLKKCIEELQLFADQIIVTVCSHFFDGKKENKKILNLAYLENPNITFLEFQYYKDHLYSPYIQADFNTKEHRHLWHSIARYIAYFYIKKSCKYILFVDSDEIFEGEKFKLWLTNFPYQKYNAFRFGSYYYFRKSTLRAKKPIRNGLMIKKNKLNPLNLLKEGERFETFFCIEGEKHLLALGIDNRPMIHHYSWVRPKNEMLKKTNWGHHFDKDWKKIIEKEFSSLKKQKKDFFLNEPLEECISYFDPLKIKIDFSKKKFYKRPIKNVIKINRKDILAKELLNDHNI